MADNQIDLTATFNPSEATKGVEKFGKAAEKSIDGVNKSVDDLQKNVKQTSNQKISFETGSATKALDLLKGGIVAAGAALVAAFTVSAVKNFFGAIIDEAIDAENNLNQLNAALQRSGTYSEESSQAMQDFASALMQTSVVDDDVIIGQLAIARNFAKTDEQARKLVEAALNLSAATGESLDTSVEQLGKTLDGTAGRLNETVPALRGVNEEALKTGAAIDIVFEQFGGAAASKLNTFQGAMAASGNAFGNLLASMGDFIIQNPIIIQAVKEVANMFSSLTDEIGDSGKKTDTFVTRGLLTLISAVRQSIPALSGLGVVFNTIGLTLDLVVKSVQNLIDIFFVLYDSWKAVTAAFKGDDKQLIDSFNSIGNSIDKIIKRSDELGVSFANVTKTDAWDNMLLSFDSSLERMQQAANKKPVEIKTSVKVPEKKTWSDLKDEAEKDTPTVDVKTVPKKEKDESDYLLKRQNELFEKFISELAQFPAKLISGAGKGAEGANQVVPELLSSLSSTLGQGLGTAIGGPIGAAVGGGIGSFMGELIKLAVAKKDEIAAKIDEFFEAIPQVLDGIVANLPMVIQKVMQNLPGTFVKIVEAIPDIIMAFVNALDELAYSLTLNSPALAQVAIELPIVIIKAATLAMINIIKGFAQGLARLVNEKWNEAVRVMTEKLLAIPSAVGDFFNSIADFFKGLSFNDAKEKVANAAMALQDGAINFFNDIKNKLKIDLPSLDLAPAVDELVKNIGKIFSKENLDKMVQALIDGVNELLDRLNPTKSLTSVGGKGPLEKALNVNLPGVFAQGGVVPPGYPDDKYPALLTSNEVVVPADTSGNLFSLINDLATGNAPTGNSSETNTLLKQLIMMLANQQKTIEVKLDRDTLAKAIISLNKDNRRLA